MPLPPYIKTLLQPFELSPNEYALLEKSFRTRIKETDTGNILQFKIDPIDITQAECEMLETLTPRLEAYLAELPIGLQIKIAACCGENCAGCMRYNNHKNK